MPGEIVTAAQILAGTGAAGWAADKLLGPSVGAVGEQINLYLSSRLTKILDAIGKREGEQGNLQPLPPGFLVTAFQKASVSEDDPDITEMWANLLIAAGSEFESRQMIFADILSQFGGAEARLLREIWKRFAPDTADIDNWEQSYLSEALESDSLPEGPHDNSFAGELASDIHEHVSRNFAVRLGNTRVSAVGGSNISVIVGDASDSIHCLILERQSLLKPFEHAKNFDKFPDMIVGLKGHELTPLGFEFMIVCERENTS